MNRVILKQQKKKEQEKDSDKKKSKEKQETIRLTQPIIEQKLLNHFQYHIGESDKTTKEEIFEVIIGVNSNMVNGFVRFYWWNIIEKIIRKLRRQDRCFIIKKNGNFFVLKDLDEAIYYKNLCDKAINHMENAQVRADDWVDKEKWRNIKDYANEDEEKPKSKEEKSVDEKIKSIGNKIKTKVLRLWETDENKN